MSRLRKTLGEPDWPVCAALMRQIETQNVRTLSRWAVDHAERVYLPLCGELPALTEAIRGCREWQAGARTLRDLKPLLRQGTAAAREPSDPIAQAAARATAAACAVAQTPTNALGYLFYGAAAAAYSQAGCDAPERWEELAWQELEQALAELRAQSVPDEKDPVQVNWNC